MFSPGTPSCPFLYPIVDSGVCAARGLDPAAVAEACLEGGARILQLRVKGGASAAFLALADRVVQGAKGSGTLVVVNDRFDVARLSGAGGVHVGQEDLAIADVRHVVGSAFVVGISTHDARQIDMALESDATYIAVGPIFTTGTKDTGYSARGLDLLRYAAGRGKPVVAIGGITLESVASVVAAGATGVAVISDLLMGNNPAARAAEFIARLTRTS